MKPENQLVIYADGSITPKGAGAGIVVQNTAGRIVLLANRLLKPMTNNEAEYQGLIMAFETATQFTPPALEVRLDSEVVIYQMLGRFSVRSLLLKPLHRHACELARQFPHVKYTCIPREANMIANVLAFEAAVGHLWTSEPA